MPSPILLNFDLTPQDTTTTGPVRLPKIYQGSPYDQTVKVKNKNTNAYRDFSEFDDIRMTLVPRQSEAAIITLSKQDGHILGLSDGLQFKFPGSVTAGLKIMPGADNVISEKRFLYTIILIKGGVEVERFAQGFGFIVSSITKPA